MTPFRLRAICLAALFFALCMEPLSVLNAGFGSLETLAFAAGSVIVGVVLGALFRTPLNFSLIAGLLVYALIDANLVSGMWEVVALVLAPIVVGLLIRYRPVEVPLGIAVFSLVFGLAAFFTPAKPMLDTREPTAMVADQDQRFSYLHIILDEQMSPTVEAPSIFPVDGREEVVRAYTDRGFRLYAHAESSSYLSYKSISDIFGFRDTTDNYVELADDSLTEYAVSENVLIDNLLTAGFSPTVIQTDYLDICTDDPRVRCSTYGTDIDLQTGRLAGISPLRRVGLAATALHARFLDGPNQIVLYRHIVVAVARLNGYKARRLWDFMRPTGNLILIDELTPRVDAMQPGDALVVHLMITHFPYVLSADCDLRERAAWQAPLPADQNATLESAYRAYWAQSICTHRSLAKLLDIAAEKDHMIVVVHGDHGARMITGVDEGDPIDQLSTMLAVKTPDSEGGLVTEIVPLPETLALELTPLLLSSQ